MYQFLPKLEYIIPYEIAKKTLILLIFIVLSACAHKQKDESKDSISASPIPSLEDSYKTNYDAYTRKAEIVRNFETKMIAQMTLLGTDLRQKIASRYESVFNEAEPILAESSKQTGFFVSLFVPHQFVDLSDSNIWKIHLTKENQTFLPVVIKKLTPKEKWRIFFPEINSWSRDFLVLFDETTPRGSEKKLLSQDPIELRISSVYGTVTARW